MIQSGSTLGHYEITGTLGEGGMGQVWRARDARLGREVAIKTLPAEFATDAERLVRFEREARLLASLNHPNIAAIHGFDHDGDHHYLVMELVEGETLADRLLQGPIPVEDALRFAQQIAEALEAAHDKGVVHRDLKPANIKVTPEGRVKVLDFGLAKAFVGDLQEASPANSPTLSLAATRAGFILGTAAYMSPEQARGRSVDKRTDIWAFGCVLYEMLTGRRAFEDEDISLTLSKILQRDPDYTALPKAVPPRVLRALAVCLRKDARQRASDIHDVRLALEGAFETSGTIAPDTPSARRSRWRLALPLAAAIVIGILAGLAGWFVAPASAPGAVARFSITLPEGQRLSVPAVSNIAVSPDGTRIAYSADNLLYLRNLDETEPRPIQGTNEPGLFAVTPAFSPDGQWLAYVAGPAASGPFDIKRVPVTGGTPVRVLSLGNDFAFGLSWPTTDTLLFANSQGVVRMPATGGALEMLATRGQDENFESPQLLPGGDRVLFARRVVGAAWDTAQIVVQSVGKDDRTVIWEGGSDPWYLPTGHLLYVQANSLFAVRLDLDRRAVAGAPVSVLDALRRAPAPYSDTANLAVSQNGTLVSIPASGNAVGSTRIQTTLNWVDRNGRAEPFPTRPDDYTMVRISPDGTKIALVVGFGRERETRPLAIWLYEAQTENLRLLVNDADGPLWTSDSRRLVYRQMVPTDEGVSVELRTLDVDTGQTALVAGATPEFQFPLPWSLSPDDQTLAVIYAAAGGSVGQIATLPMREGGQFQQVIEGSTTTNEPSIAPNGAWLSYLDGALGGAGEINIRPFPDTGRTRIPVARGGQAVFSRDGSELFFFDGEGISVVPLRYEPGLRVGAPRQLFKTGIYGDGRRNWDVDPTGQRLLIVRDPAVAAAGEGVAPPRLQIDVVLNWFEELKARVPVE